MSGFDESLDHYLEPYACLDLSMPWPGDEQYDSPSSSVALQTETPSCCGEDSPNDSLPESPRPTEPSEDEEIDKQIAEMKEEDIEKFVLEGNGTRRKKAILQSVLRTRPFYIPSHFRQLSKGWLITSLVKRNVEENEKHIEFCSIPGGKFVVLCNETKMKRHGRIGGKLKALLEPKGFEQVKGKFEDKELNLFKPKWVEGKTMKQIYDSALIKFVRTEQTCKRTLDRLEEEIKDRSTFSAEMRDESDLKRIHEMLTKSLKDVEELMNKEGQPPKKRRRGN